MKDGNISMLVYNLLAEERAYQDRKFGQCPIATDHEFLAIAGEEFGELCRAICQRRSAAEINKEAKQLAATCIAYLDHDLHWSNKS